MITSPHNKRVARAIRLKKRAVREKERRFLVEGAQGVLEAITSSALIHEVFVSSGEDRLESVLVAAREREIPLFQVDEAVMTRLTSTVTPQGVVAVASYLDVGIEELPRGASCVPILVEVRDPGNAGTILRSADASGADAVVVTKSSVDIYNPKAVRASAGSLFHMPVVREKALGVAVGALRERGFTVLAASAEGETSIERVDLIGPTAVMFGNEAHGLSEEAKSLADETVRVPIAGRAESLNLAAAATLVLFEFARRRAGDGTRRVSEAARAPGPASRQETLASIVAGAAHDIRSPLTAIKGFTSTMLSRWDRLDEEQRRFMVESIAYDGGRMELMISYLVDAARLVAGSLSLAPVPVDLLELAREVAGEVSARPLQDVEVEVKGPRQLCRGDRSRLRLALIAMVESAMWNGEEGPVIIEILAGCAVRVVRAGGSFDGRAAKDLFAPRPPGSGGGSKVGLFVARGLAEAHGGSLEVEGDGGIALMLRVPLSYRTP